MPHEKLTTICINKCSNINVIITTKKETIHYVLYGT